MLPVRGEDVDDQFSDAEHQPDNPEADGRPRVAAVQPCFQPLAPRHLASVPGLDVVVTCTSEDVSKTQAKPFHARGREELA